jgi:hypothetical protein
VLRELAVLRRLGNGQPNIVQLLDAFVHTENGADQRAIYLVFERLHSLPAIDAATVETDGAIASNSDRPHKTVARRARQLLAGVAALHGFGAQLGFNALLSAHYTRELATAWERCGGGGA